MHILHMYNIIHENSVRYCMEQRFVIENCAQDFLLPFLLHHVSGHIFMFF